MKLTNEVDGKHLNEKAAHRSLTRRCARETTCYPAKIADWIIICFCLMTIFSNFCCANKIYEKIIATITIHRHFNSRWWRGANMYLRCHTMYTMVGIHVARCLVLTVCVVACVLVGTRIAGCLVQTVCVVACVLSTAYDSQTCVSVIVIYTCITITHLYQLIEQYSRSGGSTVKLGLRGSASQAVLVNCSVRLLNSSCAAVA